ncbi:hypothetical protein [Sphingobacterium bambusae]|uniref:DUF4157 domain-containing protein n=1 Tax=Sphingobacterium bambusae TaxID=662858 RepID=A0ABW6BHU2_9SPHI|nr:hypothetical protein [Sphingobacterium bambusae]WPL50396.1 hypothetical protein SCB77_08035 [Sphingobacterium bambusae]
MMNGIVIISKFWTNFFSAGRAVAVTVFPFIFVISTDRAADKTLLQHENIHIRQALELGVLPFYIWYFLEFLVLYLRHRNIQQAYLHIIFEREAYRHQADIDYLQKRKRWAFLRLRGGV